jgi:hypothetical protein
MKTCSSSKSVVLQQRPHLTMLMFSSRWEGVGFTHSQTIDPTPQANPQPHHDDVDVFISLLSEGQETDALWMRLNNDAQTLHCQMCMCMPPGSVTTATTLPQLAA